MMMKKLILASLCAMSFIACSDLEADYENMYGGLFSATNAPVEEQPVVDNTPIVDNTPTTSTPTTSTPVTPAPTTPSANSGASTYDAASGTLIDGRDGMVYKTVVIGKQVWMAQNLNFNYEKATARSYCYNGNASSCNSYGRLYLWSAALDSAGLFSTSTAGCGYGVQCEAMLQIADKVRGACPSGWHVPSADEWSTLFRSVGGVSLAGSRLKTASGWTYSSNGKGTDGFNFSALPAGYYNSYTYDYFGMSENAHFWTSSEKSASSAYFINLSYADGAAHEEQNSKNFARSLRCVKD